MKNVIQTINPYTQEYLQSYEYHSAIERESKISTAFNLYQKNLDKPLNILEKTLLLKKFSERLNLSKSLLVQKMVEEVGKPVTDANAEVEKSIVTIQYIADHLQDYLRSHSAAAATDFQLIKSPLGVVFAIMPWNYPLWQIVRVLGACVAIGNPVLLKHADNVSGFAEELERIFSDELSGYLINLRIPVQ